ncbi:SDR family oxidoreductase [Clavibacter zhangzhiyongii]|uniref:SDR family oxidoreductase n=1 Tax=Clavibacter zhangzhiyongii TaxID=2768071 RepID=A0A7L7YZ76_9MICO|nr:SDR family oxidoreductase [Clavibacter zhangzhiyongii]QOD42778.1 SDR family oxidoreductase [Clavibacter zhangzhiyongii]
MTDPAHPDRPRPVALVTGVGRVSGIGAAIAEGLALDGWDVAFTYWSDYDARMPWGRQPEDPARVAEAVERAGGRAHGVEADLVDTAAAERILDAVEAGLGPITALVLSHAESVDSALLDTSVESLERHLAVNVRASLQLIQGFARRYRAVPGAGRIVALTSDHVVGNVPYGASKAALDRVVIAAARELEDVRITANLVDPGPTDTGWFTDEIRETLRETTPRGRLAEPRDAAALVCFLVSAEGGWINGQRIRSDGGQSVG